MIGKRTESGERVLSVRVPSAMARELVALAKREDRSMNSLVRVFIRRALESEGGSVMKTA
ncbi:MAG TPA: ribbon-helix-helix protein, CopG family [Thermoanaerobaculia bacterium]|nr:ribbon-helix-helix protein, CopG family [Thermoanaerobaculia bacterium]